MATRIYQGKILSGEVQSSSCGINPPSAFDALCDTNNHFHDAVNYHLTALAGMAAAVCEGVNKSFYHQFISLYSTQSGGRQAGDSLQESVTRTLGIRPDSSFNQVMEEIFRGVENPDVLPYVLQYIVDRTEKGEGVIQQEGRGLLPKLCDPTFKGNFDYSIKEKKASIGKKRLQNELNREDITDAELRTLALEMDLSWAGIKTQPDEKHENSLCYQENEVMQQVQAAMDELCSSLAKGTDKSLQKLAEMEDCPNLETSVREIIAQGPVHIRPLAKNNKAAPSLKQAAIFFMFYPCRLSAAMLKAKIGDSKEKIQECLYDYTQLENDPLIMARGTRGYVYKGYTALPCWETSGDRMCSSEFDILAFKEALKTLHGFVLKTEERKLEVAKIDAEIAFIEKGEGKKSATVDDEEELQAVVLGGDPRFDALKKLVKELSHEEASIQEEQQNSNEKDCEDGMKSLSYLITARTLQSYEDLRKLWLDLEASGHGDFKELAEKVRDLQSSGVRFGSQQLFESLCKDEYRIIWHDWTDSKHPRSKNMLRDFAVWQSLYDKKKQYERPVRISAANPVTSPRQLMYSDMSKKECRFVSGKSEKIQVCVAVRNERSRWEFVPAILEFSAPRFERDELGRNTVAWDEPKKGVESVSWLQPMMKALDLPDAMVKLERSPAVALYVKYEQKADATVPHVYLNFPVSLNVERLQKCVGKVDVWKNQFLGGVNEKLHLHWPDTYKAAGKVEPWWKNKTITQTGFDVLGVDLGMRSAFAWSILHVSRKERKDEASGRLVGTTDDDSWYGMVKKQGVNRIEGERSRNVKGQEVSAVALPSQEDVELVKKIYDRVQYDTQKIEEKTLLDLGKSALRVFQRLLSRTRTYQSFLSKLHVGEDVENCLARVSEYFSYGNQHSDIVTACSSNDVGRVKSLLFEETMLLRADLPMLALDVTNLLLPRKRGHWEWVSKTIPGWQGSGQMMLCEGKDTPKRRVYHRGGISIERITQLENLRLRLQSMSKILSCSVYEKVPFGRGMKDTKVMDPCPQIIEKIDNMREQRVNVVAHEIVAQALGVRLKETKSKSNPNGRDVWHGEYERIPNRAPVDFVIMENLQGYQTSIDRTPEENSALMRWSHRQITAKVVQLIQEVFGIPVLFTHAAYTSRFDCMYSSPGFRPELITAKSLQYMSLSSNDEEKDIARVYDEAYKQVQESPYKGKIALIKPHHKNAGEMFLSESCGKLILRNADVNAATNIAWRGIAAPDSLHLLHRVRMELKKGGLAPCWKNEREKALKGKWKLEQHFVPSSESNLISSFFASSDVRHLSFAVYGDSKSQVSLAHGKTLWGDLKKRHWELCHRYNMVVLRKVGLDTTPLEKLLLQNQREKEQDSDDIPM